MSAPPTRHNKSLLASQNDAIRKAARGLITSEFGGTVSRAAKALGLSQAYLAQFLSGERGAGMKLLGALSARLGVPVDTVIGAAPAPDPITTIARAVGTAMEAREVDSARAILKGLEASAELRGAAEERRAIVAWLRSLLPENVNADDLAEAIEGGAHRTPPRP